MPEFHRLPRPRLALESMGRALPGVNQMRLLLASHVATKAVHAAAFPHDEPLDRRGAAAARLLGAHLPRKRRALMGPELRCVHTADALGLAPSRVAALRDIDYGRWRGRSLAEIEEQEPDALAAWLADPKAAPHGGESVAALIARVAAWLRHLPEAPGTLVAVTHPAVLRAAIVHVLAAPVASFWRVDPGPLTLVDLRRRDRIWTLRGIADPRSVRRDATPKS